MLDAQEVGPFLLLYSFQDLVRPLLTQAVARPERLAELLGAGPDEVALAADSGIVMVDGGLIFGFSLIFNGFC